MTQESSFKYRVETFNLPFSGTVYKMSGKIKKNNNSLMFLGVVRWFLGVVYGALQKEVHGSGHRRVVSFFSKPIFKNFILTLLFAVSRLYSNVVNGYITCKI